jgi:hypothetical protein
MDRKILKKIIYIIGAILVFIIAFKILKFALAIILPIAVVAIILYFVYTKILKRHL